MTKPGGLASLLNGPVFSLKTMKYGVFKRSVLAAGQSNRPVR